MDRRAAPGLVVERARRAGFADSNRAKEYSASLGAVVVTDSIAALLDMTMVTVALGGMSRAFQAPIATTQWVTTAHLLSIAMVITVTERLGTRTMWLVALTVFMTGSALCGSAWSVGTLIAFRVA